MSAGTAPSSSSSGRSGSQSNPRSIDGSGYIYTLLQDERNGVCYYLEQNSQNEERAMWEKAAEKMGYALTDIIKIKKMAQDKSVSPAEQLLRVWSDLNHTNTELFMVLYSLKLFEAMECLKNRVDVSYHRLIPKKVLKETKPNDTISTEKILNGPEMSRTSNESEFNSTSMETSSKITVDRNEIKEVANQIPKILYNELSEATNKWSKENILGRGGFGTVFKGRWKYTDVAIKKIEYKSGDMKKNAKVQMQQSLNELRYLNSCRHDNILPLYGYSVDGPEPCLVYQFMAGGSVERRLHAKTTPEPLTFIERMKIALGTARGLQYLHTYRGKKEPLIHGDIKPANILLDSSCVPRIGDFGLVREGSDELMEVSSVYGTRPYLPVEFLANRIFSTKIDTFSYGVVIFELFTALKAHDKTRGANVTLLSKYIWFKSRNNEPMAPLIDKSMDPATVSVPLYDALMKIGLACTNENNGERPEMVAVLNTLEELMDKYQ
ncbi:serine/threonine-protein kinase pelle-like [Sitodiplosis mosellana]|uniref:serine/threonine-protein kinase pelle-like n=1 Tax=Sitodiplosis mosellana TaxID=263140 RepID=UPI0024440685|nr:serine/threonine-protein kinase pelle-like [Sitodiplosis mosellana]